LIIVKTTNKCVPGFAAGSMNKAVLVPHSSRMRPGLTLSFRMHTCNSLGCINKLERAANYAIILVPSFAWRNPGPSGKERNEHRKYT
jgi:hypothetical protein